MKLSSHEEYGLRCLLQVARHGGTGVTISDISRDEGLSVAYVGKLMRILRQGGLVKAARGQAGGYTLSSAPERIMVGEAMAALGGRVYEDDFCTRHSGSGESCKHSTDCSLRTLWRTLQGVVDEVLSKTTLHDLLRSEHEPAPPAPASLVSLKNSEVNC